MVLFLLALRINDQGLMMVSLVSQMDSNQSRGVGAWIGWRDVYANALDIVQAGGYLEAPTVDHFQVEIRDDLRKLRLEMGEVVREEISRVKDKFVDREKGSADSRCASFLILARL
ncbi:hypothetical protein ACH5RR_023471 [Cinchona calisaya]|uniref:Uncharacterized protein n=1 Tax=Cinchona calisaya TaxID=153742 RepID=A0ABD2ZAS4_9GENT